MEQCFAQMTAPWCEQILYHTGSITRREENIYFRYRFVYQKEDKSLLSATYSRVCYEKADDVEQRSFPCTDEGVEELKAWYQAQYEKYCAKDR